MYYSSRERCSASKEEDFPLSLFLRNPIRSLRATLPPSLWHHHPLYQADQALFLLPSLPAGCDMSYLKAADSLFLSPPPSFSFASALEDISIHRERKEGRRRRGNGSPQNPKYAKEGRKKQTFFLFPPQARLPARSLGTKDSEDVFAFTSTDEERVSFLFFLDPFRSFRHVTIQCKKLRNGGEIFEYLLRGKCRTDKKRNKALFCVDCYVVRPI